MTLEIYVSIWQFDHVLRFSCFNLIDEKYLGNCFNWIYLGPFLSKDDASEGNIVNPQLNFSKRS